MDEFEITTERLVMVPFAPEHAAALNEMNSNPEVMRYLGGTETLEQTEAVVGRARARWQRYGYGWRSVFLRDKGADGGPLIGAACVQNLAHVEGAPLEIGWRLRPEHQGRGYATEAGRAAMDYGFDRVGVDYLVSVANSDNRASGKVMERLGMQYVGIQTHYDEPCIVYDIHKSDRPR